MTPLTVGTWNLENLFRPGADAGPSSDQVYRAKLASLAGTIASLAPDVLAVQEVGQPEALEDLRERLGAQWHAVSSPQVDRRGIRVGFLSRLPMSDVEQIRPFPEHVAPVQLLDDGTTTTQMGRGALRVRVQSGGHDCDLVARHLKSKLLTFPGNRHNPHDEGERARFDVRTGMLPTSRNRNSPVAMSC